MPHLQGHPARSPTSAAPQLGCPVLSGRRREASGGPGGRAPAAGSPCAAVHLSRGVPAAGAAGHEEGSRAEVTRSPCSQRRESRGVLREQRRLPGHRAGQSEACRRRPRPRWRPCQAPDAWASPGGREEAGGYARGAAGIPAGAARRGGGAAAVPHRAVRGLAAPLPRPLPTALQEPLQAGLSLHAQQDPQGEPPQRPWARVGGAAGRGRGLRGPPGPLHPWQPPPAPAGRQCRLSSRAPDVRAPVLPTRPLVRALSVGGGSGVCLHPFLGSPLTRRSWGDSPPELHSHGADLQYTSEPMRRVPS